ncbi:DUF4920 domain-containing protein [Gracilimonas sp.]|uniref:DUF4920 domain-containing protein n=1 Tax=Gracilimonas sp. TaxID=1974203 RepID=UPI002871DB09|nr:DUF4920 domain-containing protein [Gracilimonas sp.]
MKKSILFVLLIGFSTLAFAQESEVIRLSEPVQVTENHEVFGAEVDTWGESTSLKSIIENEEDLSGKTVTLETEIAEVCQKKGCFFVANEGSYSARITFKDYGFFIPTDSKGKKVTLIGTFEVKELTEEKAKHYAEDAGNNPDAIKGPQKEYSIVATSVKVPKIL